MHINPIVRAIRDSVDTDWCLAASGYNMRKHRHLFCRSFCHRLYLLRVFASRRWINTRRISSIIFGLLIAQRLMRLPYEDI